MNQLRKCTVVLAVFALPLVTLAAESTPQYWQLVFSYDQSALSLPQASPIAPMAKTPRTPGLEGAPVRLPYNLDWLDAAGNLLGSATFEMPLGIRSAPVDSQPCRIIIPDQGVIVVRLIGPRSSSVPSAVRLTQSNLRQPINSALSVPSVFDQTSIVMPIQEITTGSQQALAGPIGSAKIRNTGPDGNRMVVVVMGDGYTAADLGTGAFTTQTNNLVTAFLNKSPWDIGFGVANVYRIDVTSNESGSDNDPLGVYKDTYFNSMFYTSDIARLLTINSQGLTRAINAANVYVGSGVWDAIFVLVNSTTYGGSGGTIAVSSVHPSASEIILHEYGHSYAGLADEYSDPYPGYPPGDYEPNVDFDYQRSLLKWAVWVEKFVPLPTPPTSDWIGYVGAFEGARYRPTGIYRPYLDCLMRSLGDPYCPVCKEACLQNLFSEVSLTDSTLPPASTSVLVGQSPATFSAVPVPLAGLAYEWKLAGQSLDGQFGPTLSLSATDIYSNISATGGTLTVRLSFPTSLIRQFSVSKTVGWVVKADCNGNLQADDLDITQGILHDTNHDGIPDECEAVLCCPGPTGNVDCDPADLVDISDLSRLIDNLFISFEPLCCVPEANADKIAGVDIGDLSLLIDHLFISFVPLPNCQ
ncbi:MAG: hypothetical protein HY851_05515 [candidate division Zixibacteria bacterium]|nr:hypothetical protein [candidate division Zixibacteria bacterium]